MNILVNVSDPSRIDLSHRNLIKTLFTIQSPEFVVGQCTGSVDEKEIKDFNPQVIVHDFIDYDRALHSDSCVMVALRSIKESTSCFVTPEAITLNPKKYGSGAVMLSCESAKLASSIYLGCRARGIQFKFFGNDPINTVGYCGVAKYDDRFSFYQSSKVSLCNNDQDQIDVIYANGNPLLVNSQDLFDEIVKGQTERLYTFITREEILADFTSYDVLAKIFSDLSLRGVSERILLEKAKIK